MITCMHVKNNFTATLPYLSSNRPRFLTKSTSRKLKSLVKQTSTMDVYNFFTVATSFADKMFSIDMLRSIENLG